MKKNKFLIFKPTKSAMQSGYNNSRKWCLANNDINESFISSKFCWNGSSNPEKQIKLLKQTKGGHMTDELKNFIDKYNN